MKKFITSHKLLFISIFTIAGFLLLPQDTYAATKTWNGDSVNDTWSEGTNWSPSGAPVNGDDIVFNCSLLSECGSVFDLPGLSVESITFSGTVAATVTNPTDAPITINGNIDSEQPGSIFLGALVLGTDIVVNNTALGAVDLNEFTLSMTGKGTVNSETTERWSGIAGAVSGNGVLSINVDADQEFYLSGNNTYSGVTNVNSGTFVSNGDNPSNRTIDMFGVSDVNVGVNGKVLFKFDETENGFAFNNVLSFIRTNPAYVQMEIQNDSSDASLVNIDFTDIVLNSDTRFDAASANGGLLIDLLGITANNFCIEYGLNNADQDSFVNGPDCTEDTVDDPVEEDPALDENIPAGVESTGSKPGGIGAAVLSGTVLTMVAGVVLKRRFV